MPKHGAADDDDRRCRHFDERNQRATRFRLDVALTERDHLRLAEPRLHLGEGTFYIHCGSRRVVALYVPDDGLEQPHDLDAMRISFHPPLGDLGLARTSFARYVAGDALPLVGTDLGGTPVRIRHIHLIRQTPEPNATLLGHERRERAGATAANSGRRRKRFRHCLPHPLRTPRADG